MLKILDFLIVLLTAPVALSWLGLTMACLALLGLAYGIANVVAFIHARAGESWRELLVSTTRVRISWIWGWSAASIVMLLYVSTLVYLERVESWFAALPYLLTVILIIVMAAWLRHSIRVKVIKMQKLVQGGQP